MGATIIFCDVYSFAERFYLGPGWASLDEDMVVLLGGVAGMGEA